MADEVELVNRGFFLKNRHLANTLVWYLTRLTFGIYRQE